MEGIPKFVLKFFAIYFVLVFALHQPRHKPENLTLLKEDNHYYFYETLPGTDVPMTNSRQAAGQKSRGIYRVVFPLIRGTNLRDAGGGIMVVKGY